MYIAVVQNNPTVGAFEQNAGVMLDIVDELSQKAYPPDLVVFPAFALSGMPLDGLAFSTALQADSLDIARMMINTASLPCLFGSVVPRNSRWRGSIAESEVIYCQNGVGGSLGFVDTARPRWANPDQYMQVKINEAQVAIFLDCLPDSGADFLDTDLMIIMLAKEYVGKDSMLTSSDVLSDIRIIAQESQAWIVVASLVGGQDDMVFDGGSMIIDPAGSIADAIDPFTTGVIECNMIFSPKKPAVQQAANARQNIARAVTGDKTPIRSSLPYEADWKALTLATRDYTLKNGFSDVVIGLSGGIDSALTATLAVDALGAAHVHGVLMPSIHTSESSTADALELAARLGISTLTMPVSEAVEAIETLSIETIGEPGSDTARQNMQARVRMLYLMHLSNTFGWMLLNTSNKSEEAMGYST
ncbi:MAG: NAD(+) synthase, partial [Coriobacteriia bacterium]|nr:NAD(+) synthase [Coriobacteriia bacterium]